MTFIKGKSPWNKGKRYSSKHKGRKLSEKHKQALRVPKKVIPIHRKDTGAEKESKRKRMLIFYAKGGMAGFRKKKYFNTGEKNVNWKGGITPINEKIRKSIEIRTWRWAVFVRDNFTCVECGNQGGELHADHIKQFAFHPELRLAIDNGRTLCKRCHRKTKTYGSRKHVCCK